MALTPASRQYEFGSFQLDTAAHTLTRGGADVPLAPKLFDVLLLLVEARGATVPKERFMAEVWADAIVEDASLTRTVSRLRAILGDGPGDEHYIVTVARRGYRFAAQVRDVGSLEASREESAPSPQPRPRPAGLRSWGGLLAAAVLVGVVSWIVAANYPSGRPTSLAVLPFHGLGEDAGGAALGLGLADSLITRLANDSTLTVRPTSAVHAFAGPSVDPVAAGRALAVDAVVEGTVRRVGDKYRVNIRLVDVATGAPSWGQTFDEDSLNLIAVEDRLAERVGQALSLVLRPAAKPAAGTTNPEAYEAYLRGRFTSFQLSKEAFEQSRRDLNRAIVLDPNFAKAFAALAYLHINTVDLVAPPREAFTSARTAVERALMLDPALADAHTTLALIEWQFGWNWAAAERGFKKALDLDPQGVFARSQYAFFLSSMGRADESIAESERARAADPISLEVSTANATAFLWARRFNEAADRSARLMTIAPDFWLAVSINGRATEYGGDVTTAIATYRKALKIPGAMPEALMDLGRALAKAGHRQEAEQTLRELEDFGRRAYAAPFHIAVVCAALGQRDRAFLELDRAIEARSWYMTWLKVEPSLDVLRNDPRFDQRLRRVGF